MNYNDPTGGMEGRRHEDPTLQMKSYEIKIILKYSEYPADETRRVHPPSPAHTLRAGAGPGRLDQTGIERY